MKFTVNQVAKLTGVSVRTLHYYDEIGLLIPGEVTDAGYRLYDEENLETLQQILFLREIEYKLKDIKVIINDSNFNKEEALIKQKNILKLKRDRLNALITLIENTIKGEEPMSFKEFDMTEIEKAQKEYKKEVEEKWGESEAYKESKRKTSQYTKSDWNKINSEAEVIYKGFLDNIKKEVSDEEVQNLVVAWKKYITNNFYNCTDEILRGLGEMYIADERFTKNIDKYGVGLAEFMSKAIEYYCNK